MSKPYSLRERKQQTLLPFLEEKHSANGDSDYSEQSQHSSQVRSQANSEAKPSPEEEDCFEEAEPLPNSRSALQLLLEEVKDREAAYRQQYLKEQQLHESKSYVEENAVPISGDVRTFDWQLLADTQERIGGRLFDVIMMDPPWRLSSSQPSRGVAIQYDSLSDQAIQAIPVPLLSKCGFLLIWTINAKYRFAINLLQHWGYKPVDEIVWVKKTVKGKMAKGHGFYLQHAKESCLVGVKGQLSERFKLNVASDVIFSERRGQSQKPPEIYQYVEELCPSGFYLQIFGRRNNIRDKWVTIGNQI